MKRIVSCVMVVCFVTSMFGCASTGDGSSAKSSSILGGVLGALGGAAIGLATTGKVEGAVAGAAIGAAAGAVTGFVIGRYRDKQYKTADQIYRENPAYATPGSSSAPPTIKNLDPYIADMNGRRVNTLRGGETVDLAMKYDIVIPRYSGTKTAKVVEHNTLIAPDGKKMEEPKLTRERVRPVQGVDAGVAVKIPANLPAGNYTHVATVKMGDQEYQQTQTIVVAKLGDSTKMYVANTRR